MVLLSNIYAITKFIISRECLSNSNNCPFCQAQFYQNESQLNTMIKEAILYVKSICDIGSKDCSKQTDAFQVSQLPDLNLGLSDNSENNSAIPKILSNVFAEPFPVAQLTSIQNNNDSKGNTKNSSRRANPPSQAKARANSTGRRATGKTQEKKKIEESQRPRSQSVKKLRKNEKGESALHILAMNGNLTEIEELIKDSSIDVNAKDFAGWTPLHEACNKGFFDIMKLLLENNADINAVNHQNNSPLHEATLNKRYECVKYLLENGADQSLRNHFGFLAKDYLRNKPDYKHILELFDKDILNDTSQRRIESIVDLNQSDLTMSSSFRESRRGRSKPKKMILFGTGMNDLDKIKLSSLASQLNLQIAAEMNDNVTHVIFSSPKVCTRTLNYMKAILMGIWVVSIKWLEESVDKGYLIRENEFEAEGSIKTPQSNGPFKGRLNASCQYPKLFEDCSFFLHGEFKVFDKQDFVKLIDLAGGKILKREPKLERVEELIPVEIPPHIDNESSKNFNCSHFILFDSAKIKEINHQYLKSVKPSWLFTCIDNFKIVDPQKN